MTNDSLIELLDSYGIHRPRIEFIRHNENRTYKVTDSATGNEYLFRMHQPVTPNMAGLQHTGPGLLSELQLLTDMADQTKLIVQRPVRDRNGHWIAKIEHERSMIHCSLLTWIKGRPLQKEAAADAELAGKIGAQLAELHRFFRKYRHRVHSETRPVQGIERNDQLLSRIQLGVETGLIALSDFRVVKDTIRVINSRLERMNESQDCRGIIHGDLNLGNIILTEDGEISFIDFGLFGFGYYVLDVAMAALMVPSQRRIRLLEAYYDSGQLPGTVFPALEGCMLLAIFGYYAFHMENERVHPWIRERMPQLCAKHCLPFLSGESILYSL
ncbi:phosphotransferase enzyme family protein [Paenibacillus piri]|uniref:Aminoglycoside phosphotransferase family protein n=1 Tax=Paenibacillus piri TaxID=2547395 RepID=A0A4R5KF28_9BACL|nr:aminoglycoside phosphotransferase family protein [Paenibacillus piri]TDF93883.1 aminoglycoside phosphotransferase family protein [Paenibacillus piri]